MSQEFVENTKFRVVFGVDHVTSAFLQVWAQPYDDQESPLVAIDNLGIRINQNVRELTILNAQTYERFQLERSRNHHYPNLSEEDIIAYLRATGLESHENTKKVFTIFD